MNAFRSHTCSCGRQVTNNALGRAAHERSFRCIWETRAHKGNLRIDWRSDRVAWRPYYAHEIDANAPLLLKYGGKWVEIEDPALRDQIRKLFQ